MEQCCNNTLTSCTTIDPCFYTLAIRVPPSYGEQFVTLYFAKEAGKAVGFKVDCEVISGWAAVDVEAIPNAFFNPYGNPYLCQFISTVDLKPVEFTSSGQAGLNGFYFTATNLVQQGGLSQINIFDTEIYVNP